MDSAQQELQLVPDFDVGRVNWASQAVISWSGEDCEPNFKRLRVKTGAHPAGEYVSHLTFLRLFDSDRNQLQKYACQYRLKMPGALIGGLPTILAISAQPAMLTEIVMRRAKSDQKQQRPQRLVQHAPLAKKSERERAFGGLDRKLRELYESEEFRVVKSLYPEREEHQLLGQYIQLQHTLQKQLVAQLDQELESQMQVVSPDPESLERPRAGIRQMDDPLYAYPRSTSPQRRDEDEEFSFGPGSPQYEPQFGWVGSYSPVYKGIDEESDDATV